MEFLEERVLKERLKTFVTEVARLEPLDVVRKHVIHGDCALFSKDSYYDLRAHVAKSFSIHPNEVVIIGSAKLGFSIAPSKRYRPFGNESDIDVVLISTPLFDEFWQRAFIHHDSGGFWPEEKRFRDYLFKGWIRPDHFPPEREFELGRKWWEYFRGLTASEAFGPHKIRGALYRSWDFLERYQVRAVDGCRSKKGLTE